MQPSERNMRGKSCVVDTCNNREGQGICFHRIPKDTERRKLWLAALEETTVRGAHQRICGQHFTTGKKSDDPYSVDYVPSINLHAKNVIGTLSSLEQAKSAITQYHQGNFVLMIDGAEPEVFAWGKFAMDFDVKNRLRSKWRKFLLMKKRRNVPSTEVDDKDLGEAQPSQTSIQVVEAKSISKSKQASESHNSTIELRTKEGQSSIDMNTNMKHRCRYCGYSSAYKSNVDLHVKQDHEPAVETDDDDGGGMKVCHLCEKSFIHDRLLKNHIHETHVDSYGKIECPECKKSYPKSRFQEHYQSHTIKYACQMCQKSYIRKRELNAHISIKHGESYSIPCEHCPKKFSHKKKLTTHIKHVHNKDPIICEKCGDQLKNKPALIRHLRKHSQEPNPPVVIHPKPKQPPKRTLSDIHGLNSLDTDNLPDDLGSATQIIDASHYNLLNLSSLSGYEPDGVNLAERLHSEQYHLAAPHNVLLAAPHNVLPAAPHNVLPEAPHIVLPAAPHNVLPPGRAPRLETRTRTDSEAMENLMSLMDANDKTREVS